MEYRTSVSNQAIGTTGQMRELTSLDYSGVLLAFWTFLHMIDKQDQNIVRIYTIWPVLYYLLPNFCHYCQARLNLSLDVAIIPLENYLTIEQYIKDEPAMWSIKSFHLCEGKSGYVLSAEIY